MGSASDDNRFAPPLAHVEDVAPAGTGALAGRGTRLLAVLVDALLAGFAFGAIALLTPINVFHPRVGSSGHVGVLLINVVLGFIIFVVIHGYLLAARGQTVGKALLKIRIVRSDGSPASFGRILGLRYLPTTDASLRSRSSGAVQPDRQPADLPPVAALPARQHRRHDRRQGLSRARSRGRRPAMPDATSVAESRLDTRYAAETPEGIAFWLRPAGVVRALLRLPRSTPRSGSCSSASATILLAFLGSPRRTAWRWFSSSCSSGSIRSSSS